jgi:hypothetical protein
MEKLVGAVLALSIPFGVIIIIYASVVYVTRTVGYIESRIEEVSN